MSPWLSVQIDYGEFREHLLAGLSEPRRTCCTLALLATTLALCTGSSASLSLRVFAVVLTGVQLKYFFAYSHRLLVGDIWEDVHEAASSVVAAYRSFMLAIGLVWIRIAIDMTDGGADSRRWVLVFAGCLFLLGTAICHYFIVTGGAHLAYLRETRIFDPNAAPKNHGLVPGIKVHFDMKTLRSSLSAGLSEPRRSCCTLACVATTIALSSGLCYDNFFSYFFALILASISFWQLRKFLTFSHKLLTQGAEPRVLEDATRAVRGCAVGMGAGAIVWIAFALNISLELVQVSSSSCSNQFSSESRALCLYMAGGLFSLGVLLCSRFSSTKGKSLAALVRTEAELESRRVERNTGSAADVHYRRG